MLLPEDKEFITLLIQGSNAKIEALNDLTNEKIDGINARLDKLNGRTAKTEDKVEQSIKDRLIHNETLKGEIKRLETLINTNEANHPLICPQAPRLTKLETENFTKKEIKKFMIQTITITGVVVTIIFTIGKLFFGL